jgi:predicted small secreted protein
MKKVLFSVAFAAFALASCGNAAELAQKLKDSLMKDSLMKDSMAKAAAAQHIKDSLMQDSMNKAAAMQRVKDSLMQDSIEKSKKGGSKPKPKPPVAPNTPQVGKKKPGAM